MKRWLFITLLCAPCYGTTYYVAQNAGVFGGGTVCNGHTAITVATFNATALNPGDIVWICGTVGSSTVGSNVTLLVPNGSGSSGNPITINFDTGGILQAPDFGGGGAAIKLDGLSYITVDGKGTGNAAKGTFVANGIIQATLSGTSGGTCIGGTCSHNNGGTGISGTTTNNLIIKNLEIIDIYLRTSGTDQAPDWATYFCIHTSPSSNLLITNNYMTDSGEIVAPNGNNIEISNNYLANTNHEISLGAGSTSWSNTWIHDNHFGPMAVWDAGSPFPYHHDGIHIFPGSPGFYLSVFIYNNQFDGDIGSISVTGWIYAEAACCTGGTLWVFNNVSTTTPGRSAPAIFGLFGASTTNVANNTVFQTFYTGGGVALYVGVDSSSTVNIHQNNIVQGQSYDIGVAVGTVFNGTGAMNYNTYVDGSGNGNTDNFTYPGHDTQSLTTWQNQAFTGAATHDANSQLISPSSILLNSDGSLQSGSPARNAGVNLYSTCNGQSVPGLGALCFDKAGVARPSSAAWDVGAYQYGTAPPPPSAPVLSIFATQLTEDGLCVESYCLW